MKAPQQQKSDGQQWHGPGWHEAPNEMVEWYSNDTMVDAWVVPSSSEELPSVINTIFRPKCDLYPGCFCSTATWKDKLMSFRKGYPYTTVCVYIHIYHSPPLGRCFRAALPDNQEGASTGRCKTPKSSRRDVLQTPAFFGTDIIPTAVEIFEHGKTATGKV